MSLWDHLPPSELVRRRDELAAAIAPGCRVCGVPTRAEFSHFLDGGSWRVRASLVCPAGHRSRVEPLP